MNLYIHVPFCARRCSYCDFSIAVRRTVPSARFAEAVLQEWRGVQGDPGWDESPELDTVYFGGGTPSGSNPPRWPRSSPASPRSAASRPGAEVTLEANPDDVTAGGRGGLARRRHQARLARRPVVRSRRARVDAPHAHGATSRRGRAILRGAGFADLSLDLIYGLPAELRRDWQADLDQAFALEPDHLSCYGLTVETHTPLGHWTARGEATAVDEVQYAEEFLRLSGALAERGWEHYEVSNAARPGHRARHNSGYWTGARLPRARSLGPQRHRRRAPVEHPRVRRLGRRHSARDGTRSPGGNR